MNQSKSPLRGIHAGLSCSDFPCQFVVACDMPFINISLVKYMDRFISDYDAVVPRIGGHYQPLHSFYSKKCISIIEHQIKTGNNKVTDFYKMIRLREVTEEEVNRFDPEHRSFININTLDDYDTAIKLL